MVSLKCHFANAHLMRSQAIRVVQYVAQFGNSFIKPRSEFYTLDWSDSGQIEVS